jgi:TPR repeat protein
MRRTIREEEPASPSTRVSTLGADELTTTAKRRGLESPRLANVLRGDLDWIVMKCLEKDRARRYETANGLAMDIQRHLSNEPVVACPPTVAYKLRKLARRNKLVFSAACSIAASLLIGAGIATWMYFGERTAKREQARLRQLAEAKETTARQVSQFLKDMLQSVGPSVALGRDTTLLREILQNTADRVQKDLKSQPVTEAELLSVIGHVYNEMEEYGKAEIVHRLALSLRRSALGSEHADVATSLRDLGWAIMCENRRAEAEPLLREALAIRRRVFGPEHPLVAASLKDLASVLQNESYSLAEAEPLEREALAMRRKLLGEEHPDVAQSLDDLALCLWGRGKLAEAEVTCLQCLDLKRKLFGLQHPEVADSLRTLTLILQAQGRLEEAERTCREALEMKRKMNGAESRAYALSLRELSGILEALNRVPEAENSYRESVAIFRKLVARGGVNPRHRLPETLRMLGRNLRAQGKAEQADEAFREALPLFREAAEHGYSQAQLSLGIAYHVGEGVAKDASLAVLWCRRAAEQELAPAQHNLAACYLTGEGVPQDYSQAVKWYRRAADHDDPTAQYNLGVMYSQGHGVPKDNSEALKWYTNAANGGNANAQNALGRMYETGNGVAKEPTEALKWYTRAAQQGDAAGQCHLASMYLRGEGVPKDSNEAMKWYGKAVHSSNPAALNDAAWLLATSPEPGLRDGTNAVILAERAASVTNRKDPGILDTLAAAYAETGQFEKAAKAESDAIEVSTEEGEKKDFTNRLALYRAGSPYREP